MKAVPGGADTLDDATLVTRVRAGETELYAVLVRRHQRAVWRVAACMLGDRAATENLVQQCFLDAFAHLDQFRVNEDLQLWLKAIARNLVRQQIRSANREQAHLRNYHQALLMQLDAADELESLAAFEERQTRLRQALSHCRDALSAIAARALSLKYEEGKSVEEVATLLGRTPAATRQLLMRTRTTLRDCVAARVSAA